MIPCKVTSSTAVHWPEPLKHAEVAGAEEDSARARSDPCIFAMKVQHVNLDVFPNDFEAGGPWMLANCSNFRSLADMEPLYTIGDEDLKLLSRIAVEAYTRYDRAGHPDDLDLAVTAGHALVKMTPAHDRTFPDRLNFLAGSLGNRFHCCGSSSDLNNAIDVAREVVTIARVHHPDRARLFENLRIWLICRYDSMEMMSDLDEAIEVQRMAVAISPIDSRAISMFILFGILEDRYRKTESNSHLDQVIKAARDSVEAAPVSDPLRFYSLSGLAASLRRRFSQIGDISSLDEAIIILRQGIALISPDLNHRAEMLNNLGEVLLVRATRLGSMSDLEEASVLTREALATMTQDGFKRAVCLNSLGNILARSYLQKKTDVSNLDEPVDLHRQAVTLARGAGFLRDLAVGLSMRYSERGALRDLEEAIDVAREAVSAVPRDQHANRVSCLENLGTIIQHRYLRTGAMRDLDESVDVLRECVENTPETDPHRPFRLDKLGNKLELRFVKTGVISDLDEATKVTREALAKVHLRHSDRSNILHNLGNKIVLKYESTWELGNLDEAIHIAWEVKNNSSSEHREYSRRLNALSSLIWYRHMENKTQEDLELCIALARQAIALSNDGNVAEAGLWNNLGFKLETRYSITNAISDLKEATSMFRRAVEITPIDHPDRAKYLLNLGNQTARLFDKRLVMSDVDSAVNYFQQSWATRTASPFLRIKAAMRCIMLLALIRPGDAVQLGKEVVQLLPLVNPKLLDYSDQQQVMSTFTGIASEVCSLLVQAGEIAEAVEYLEQGRAIIIGHQIDIRSDISDLAEMYPELSQQYEQLRKELNMPFNLASQASENNREVALKRRRQLDKRLLASVRKIRAVRGYERFLLGQTAAEIQACAEGGVIVVVNVAQLGCEAILISASFIRVTQLDDMTVADAEAWLRIDWSGGGRQERAAKNRKYAEYLAWLWRTCVNPIFDTLDGRSTENENGDAERHQAENMKERLDQQTHRIWWIGSGLAGSMPFHAAGIHRAGCTDTAFHRAISSYAPSVKALAHAQKRMRIAEGRADSESIMVVTMPTTPAEADGKRWAKLDGVLKERDALVEIAQRRISHLDMMQPSVRRVLDELPHRSIAHFACHGSTDLVDPSNSGLILQKKLAFDDGDGDSDSSGAEFCTDKLTVKRLSEMDLKHVKLAYLSACSTAQNKAEKLVDEAIHVVSGFQMAGFPHVVGCLWPSNDRVCIKLASRFYTALLGQTRESEDGKAGVGTMEVAASLREAVMAVREDEMSMPLHWAQFVHYGP